MAAPAGGAASFLPAPPPRALASVGEKWHKYDWEYSYVEMLILILVVCLALAFEAAVHNISHRAAYSYRYGDELAKVVARPEQAAYAEAGLAKERSGHLRLMTELVNRARGEFMSLGFLAFCVFLFNICGGFKVMAQEFPEGTLHMPKSETDWFRMVELVHMKLFIGMVIYFCVVSCISLGSVHRIRKWEQLRLRRAHLAQAGQAAAILPEAAAHDAELQRYLHWRRYFFDKLFRWRVVRPAFVRILCDEMNVDPSAEDAMRNLQLKVQEQFQFSSYLSLNVERGVRDSIQVHKVTWLVMLALFVVFALLCRFAHADIMSCTPVFVAMTVGILAMMQWLVRYKQHRIEAFAPRAGGLLEPPSEQEQELKRNVHQRFSTELLALRVLQVILFLLSYVFARTLMDVNDWTTRFTATMLNCSLFVLVFAVITFVLPRQVPVFLAVMSLPPFVDDGNLQAFFDVLFQDRPCPDALRMQLAGSEPPMQPGSSVEGNGEQDMGPDEEGAARSGEKGLLPLLRAASSAALKGGADLAAIRACMAEIEKRLRTVEAATGARDSAEPAGPAAPPSPVAPPDDSGGEAAEAALRGLSEVREADLVWQV